MDRRQFSLSLLSLPPVILAGAAEAARAAPRGASSDAAAAAQMISAIRARYGRGPVGIDPRMNAAAQYQAGSIARIGSLSHGDFAGRVRQFGLRGAMAENLAYGANDVGGAIAQWQGSSAHLNNLLMPGASRIGVGRADGLTTRYWAMVIG
ncbi:CAP domain-containing protein [Enterovirga rhinocerotis]|uniref:Uncharacterized protein YkwD n=1 Tax=Enterovirga rhinocerotis TaxID=1339210 RepID=A0A4R7C066_9HYPH|nr:CAP domain-containing protein [Enterovirga rhinocerotis]TDR89766.1 uncharacterized protein YkwD [Enterovirga rhinocerotis]